MTLKHFDDVSPQGLFDDSTWVKGCLSCRRTVTPAFHTVSSWSSRFSWVSTLSNVTLSRFESILCFDARFDSMPMLRTRLQLSQTTRSGVTIALGLRYVYDTTLPFRNDRGSSVKLVINTRMWWSEQSSRISFITRTPWKNRSKRFGLDVQKIWTWGVSLEIARAGQHTCWPSSY